MPLPNAYSLKTSCIPKYFEAISNSTIPDRFDTTFLSNLGFRYAIDRSFVDIMRELGFLNPDGTPTERYYDFHATGNAQQSIGVGVKAAYSDLFDIHDDAYTLSTNDIFDKLKLLYAGKKSDIMIAGIAKTFQALCKYAGLGDNGARADTPATATSRQETVAGADAGPPLTDHPRDASSPHQDVPEARQAATHVTSGNNPEHPGPQQNGIALTDAIEEPAAAQGFRLDLSDAFAVPTKEPQAAPAAVATPAPETPAAMAVPEAPLQDVATLAASAPEAQEPEDDIVLLIDEIMTSAVEDGLTLDLTDAFAVPAREPQAAPAAVAGPGPETPAAVAVPDAPSQDASALEAQVSREEILLLTGVTKAPAAAEGLTLDLTEAVASPAEKKQAAPTAVAAPGPETPAAAAVPDASFQSMTTPDASAPEARVSREEILLLTGATKAPTAAEGLTLDLTEAFAVPAAEPQAAPGLEPPAPAPAPEAPLQTVTTPAAETPEAQVSREEIVLLTDAIKAMAAEASLTLDLAEALAVPAKEPQAAPAAIAAPGLETPVPGIAPASPFQTKETPAASEPGATRFPDEIFEFVNDSRTQVEQQRASDGQEAANAGSGQAAATAEERAASPRPGAKPARANGLLQRITFVLPESRDPRVYDAIFTSLKNNFL